MAQDQGPEAAAAAARVEANVRAGAGGAANRAAQPDRPPPSPGDPTSPPPQDENFRHLYTDVPSSSSRLQVRIGHYLIIREIAMGGMATVYEALQDQPRRVVALKLLRVGWSAPAAQRRFEFESQLLARLRHPNIAQVYEAGTHEHGETRVPYFAMELIPAAKSITAHAAEQKLSPAQCMELFVKICDAVHYANTKGIVHRDLKPGNILVDLQGVPKVIDFGVARAADSDQFSPTLQTSAGQLIGTLQYMSPEQCQIDPRELDARSDVYSLGVILYELLCGELPYDVTKANLSDATKIVREQPPRKPSLTNPALAGDVETVLSKALHKDRERRYQSADALAADLRHVLAGEPIEARRDSAVYVLRRRTRTLLAAHRIAAVLIAVLVAAVATHVLDLWMVNSTSLNDTFERWMTVHLSHAPKNALRHVRLAVIDENDDMHRLAQEIPGANVINGSARTYRIVHARLLEKLIAAKPRCVVFDVGFAPPATADGAVPAPPTAADLALADAMRRLRESGCDVVVAAGAWHPTGGSRTMSIIAEHARWGHPLLDSTAGPWSVQLINRTVAGYTEASLALVAVAACWHPGKDISFNLDAGREFVEVHSADGAKNHIELTEALLMKETLETYGLTAGDILGRYFLEVPSDAAFRRSTRSYSDVFRADADDLSGWCSNKVVFIANAPVEKLVTAPDGRNLKGFLANAIAIDSLLSGTTIRRPRVVWLPGIAMGALYLFETFAVIAGAAIGVVVRRVRWTCVLTLVAVCVLTATSLAGYTWGRQLYFPIPAVCGAVLGAALAALAARSSREALVGMRANDSGSRGQINT